jgi:hypothetical protein
MKYNKKNDSLAKKEINNKKGDPFRTMCYSIRNVKKLYNRSANFDDPMDKKINFYSVTGLRIK